MFKDLVAEEIIDDSNWAADWQANRNIDEAVHDQLLIADEIAPITLFVNKETGRISKLATMEHDIAMGDVPLEVTYHDWQTVDGVDFPMRVKLSVADAPILDVKRSAVTVNPVFDEHHFAIPEGAVYEHDTELARRGASVGQWIMAIAHGASPDKPVGHLKITPKQIAAGVHVGVFRAQRSYPDSAG